jgi:hypothetical protein
MRLISIRQLVFAVTILLYLALIPRLPVHAFGGVAAPAAATAPLDDRTLRKVQDLSKRLMDAENRKDFPAVQQMVWNSPSALFVAKTATAAEGNWAGFWGHDVVVQHLHDVIFGGPFHMEGDYTKARVVALSRDVVETYVPTQITVGYAGQTAVPKPFLILIDWVWTSAGWKMASDIAIPIPPPSPMK